MKKQFLPVLITIFSLIFALLPNTEHVSQAVSTNGFVNGINADLLGTLNPSLCGATQTNGVRSGAIAAWENGQGLPDPGKNSSYALYFQKNCPTQTYASAGGWVFSVYAYQPLSKLWYLGFDVRNDGHCGAGAPRMMLMYYGPNLSTGGNVPLGCSAALKATIPGQTNWTRVYYTQSMIQDAVKKANVPLESIFHSIQLKYDDGLPNPNLPASQTNQSFVYIDNIVMSDGVTAYTASGPGTWGQSTLPSVNPNAKTQPTITTNGIKNSANFTTNLAPNTIASIFGNNLATCTRSSSGLPLPQEICGTSIKVNGTKAQLFYVSANQINFLIPPDISLGNAEVVVENNKILSLANTIQIVNTAPGLYSQSGDGRGLGVIQKYPNYTLVNTNNAARPGDYLILYGTGMGRGKNTYVKINGTTVPVLYAGPNGYVGQDQINIQLPLNGINTNTNPGWDLQFCVENVCSNSVKLPFTQ